MVISKIIGGLGNQMFQYATGRAVASRSGTDFKLDITGYKNQNAGDTKRSYELGIFNIKEHLAETDEIKRLKGNSGSFVERVVRTRYPILNKFVPTAKTYLIENPDQKFEKRILKKHKIAYLEGWWQNWKYFDKIRPVLLKEFTLKRQLSLKSQKILSEIEAGESVGIHIRLGDYLAKYNNYFVTLPPAYYRKALKRVSQKVPIDKIYVFIERGQSKIARKIVPEKYLCKIIMADPDNTKEWQEPLLLLKSCKHQIISNSSFSWWAAYLNKNPKKIVVAPKKWLVTQKFSTNDRVPSTWIKI